MMTSADRFAQTFEMVEEPQKWYNDVPPPLPPPYNPAELENSKTEDSGDYVMVLPDCFNLDKPLPDFSPLTSSMEVMDTPNMSCDGHVSSSMLSSSITLSPRQVPPERNVPTSLGSPSPPQEDTPRPLLRLQMTHPQVIV